VQINGNNAKPSKLVKPGDEISVRKGSALLSYRVKLVLSNRVGAALVSDYAENITPESELAKLHAPTETFFVRRDKGSGRPTKKERRILEELWDSVEAP
jgi:ribosome-associated heat shock protein Hsp15